MILLAAILSLCGGRIPNPESRIPEETVPPSISPCGGALAPLRGEEGSASAGIRDSEFGIRVPQESAQRLRAGQEKIKVRDFDGAIPEFQRCLELQPEEFNASFGLGICFWEKEEFGKSRDQFKRVVELVGKSSPGAPLLTVHQKLLGCALLLEDFDAAITEATALIQVQATGEYFYARALARQRKGSSTPRSTIARVP